MNAMDLAVMTPDYARTTAKRVPGEDIGNQKAFRMTRVSSKETLVIFATSLEEAVMKQAKMLRRDLDNINFLSTTSDEKKSPRAFDDGGGGSEQARAGVWGGGGGGSGDRGCLLEDRLENGAAPAAICTEDYVGVGGAGVLLAEPQNPRPRMAITDEDIRGGLGAVKRLLAAGADPNRLLVGGGTALHVAAQLGAHEIVEALLVHGGDLNARDSRGQSPLIAAIRSGHSRVAEVLVNAGCDVGVRAWGPHCYGYAALDMAAEKGDIGILNMLLKHGADPMAADSLGNTAMHVAAYHGQLGAVETLVDAGGNVAAKNAWGLVPTLVARDPGHPALLALLARGAMKNSRRGLPSFGLDARVEAPRVRLRLSPDAFTPVNDTRHDESVPGPAGHPPNVRYRAKEG
eukprot:g7594.t1